MTDRTSNERTDHERWLADTWALIERVAAETDQGHRVSLSPRGCLALLEERRARETTEKPADEVAWLIEFTPFPEPLYLSADGSFDRDHLKAVRFSRKQDGEAMLAYMHKFRTDHGYNTDPRYTRILHGEDCYRVTEHMWCSPVKSISPREPLPIRKEPQ